jgi:hypothetical protein
MPAELHFWRDSTGNELDLLFEVGGDLQAVEIKSGATFVPEWLKALNRWRRLAGERADAPAHLWL